MKNVTPKAGQVWESKVGICFTPGKQYEIIRELNPDEFLIEDDTGDRDHHASSAWINNDFEFIPQNDLEWLAVNVDVWHSALYNQIFKDVSSYTYCADSVFVTVDKYTRQQWQNTRYELGLDDRPKITGKEVADEIAGMLRSGQLTAEGGEFKYNKKETKMIDLSNAKVGDEFVSSQNNIYELALISKDKNDYALTGKGSIQLVDHMGRSLEADSEFSIVANHEPISLQDFGIYKFTIGGLINCVGTYIDHRKSFMNCGNKVCGASEAKDIVKLSPEANK